MAQDEETRTLNLIMSRLAKMEPEARARVLAYVVARNQPSTVGTVGAPLHFGLPGSVSAGELPLVRKGG